MGDFDQIRSLLETSLSSINQTLQIHQQTILNLQKENQELRDVIRGLSTKKGPDPLVSEVMSTFKRNKKRIIKNKIIEEIRIHSHLTIPEIKEVIVDQHNYCSKATFYRYIEELKRHDFIHITEHNIAKIKPLVESV